MAVSVRPANVLKYRNGDVSSEQDLVVAEEPLEIRVGYGPQDSREQVTLTVTMRTTGDDEDLAVGFLFSEGVIHAVDDILSVKYCGDLKFPEESENVIRIELSPGVRFSLEKVARNFYTNSSCGVCGKASLESLAADCQVIPQDTVSISADTLAELPDKMAEHQKLFDHTGGIHASALFSVQGKLHRLKEDVGRHNALDKLIGSLFAEQKIPCNESVLMLSGRVSFDLMQKAVRAGIPIVAAVGAPSSLALEVAREYGVTLIGFLKEGKFNIYNKAQRII